MKLTKQGLPDLNDGGRNGKRETRTGGRQLKPKLHGVCEHDWQEEVDEFGESNGFTCRRCPAWTNHV